MRVVFITPFTSPFKENILGSFACLSHDYIDTTTLRIDVPSSKYFGELMYVTGYLDAPNRGLKLWRYRRTSLLSFKRGGGL